MISYLTLVLTLPLKDKKVSGSSMDAVDNISGLMLGKMQKASDAKKKTRETTTAPYTTTVVTTTTTTTTTVAPTTVAEVEEEDDPAMEIKADGVDLKMQNLNPNATGNVYLHNVRFMMCHLRNIKMCICISHFLFLPLK